MLSFSPFFLWRLSLSFICPSKEMCQNIFRGGPSFLGRGQTIFIIFSGVDFKGGQSQTWKKLQAVQAVLADILSEI